MNINFVKATFLIEATISSSLFSIILPPKKRYSPRLPSLLIYRIATFDPIDAHVPKMNRKIPKPRLTRSKFRTTPQLIAKNTPPTIPQSIQLRHGLWSTAMAT